MVGVLNSCVTGTLQPVAFRTWIITLAAWTAQCVSSCLPLSNQPVAQWQCDHLQRVAPHTEEVGLRADALLAQHIL